MILIPITDDQERRLQAIAEQVHTDQVQLDQANPEGTAGEWEKYDDLRELILPEHDELLWEVLTMFGVAIPIKVTCRHCGRPIRNTSEADPNTPWVHDDSGNSFCDVHDPGDAVRLAGTPGRTEATP